MLRPGFFSRLFIWREAEALMFFERFQLSLRRWFTPMVFESSR
jgi:hypothetical protein